MADSSVQLIAEVQIPFDKIPFYRRRSREPDFAERLAEDLISAAILDPSERQQLLGEKSKILSVVRLDMPIDLPTLNPTP